MPLSGKVSQAGSAPLARSDDAGEWTLRLSILSESERVLSNGFPPISANLPRYAAPETAPMVANIATAHVQKQKMLLVMETKTINLRVSADAAEVYESASAEEKRKLEALVSSRLREAARHRERGQTLEEIMSELSRNAQKRGLTPKKLADILNEE